MMNLQLDHGARCSSHVGEAFRVRCYDCDALAAEEPEPARPVKYSATEECDLHPGYPTPCDLCKRLREVH